MGRTNGKVGLGSRGLKGAGTGRRVGEGNARLWLQPNEVIERLREGDKYSYGKSGRRSRTSIPIDAEHDSEIFICAECDAAFHINHAHDRGDDLICASCAGEEGQ